MKRNQPLTKKKVLLPFLLITKALLIAVTIYYYMIKYGAKKTIYFHFNLQITNQKKIHTEI